MPVLFSQTLRDNLLLGLPEDATDPSGAIHARVLEKDIATLDGGLAMRVDPRGVRLSGGQLQRTAAARMFVHSPELIVVDDLSSALDVETDRVLVERLIQVGAFDAWRLPRRTLLWELGTLRYQADEFDLPIPHTLVVLPMQCWGDAMTASASRSQGCALCTRRRQPPRAFTSYASRMSGEWSM